MKTLIVVKKPNAAAVLKPRKRVRQGRGRAIHVHTLAAVFKRYDESIAQADLLFEVFSPERLEAQRVALDRLKERLSNLGLDNVDWSTAYSNVVQYAKIQTRAA